MRKYRFLLIVTIVLFLLVNTSQLWDDMFGAWAFPAFIFLLAVYGLLLICLLYQLFLTIKEKFKNKPRVYLTGTMIVLLLAMYVKPIGIINFDSFEGPDLLTARRVGVANCHTILKLKKDHSFYLRETCFGVEKFSGRYTVDNDTIRFESGVTSRGEQYQYAMVKPIALLAGNVGKEIMLFRSKRDTIPLTLGVDKDELTMGLGY